MLLTFVINHYTKALLYFSVLAQLLLKGQIFPEELRRKIYSTKEKLDKKKKKKTRYLETYLGREKRIAIVSIVTIVYSDFQVTCGSIRL